MAQGARPSVGDVQGYFASLWRLEAEHRPVRYGEKDTPESLLDLGARMLAVLADGVPPETAVVAVEQPFTVPLIDQETGEVLDRTSSGVWISSSATRRGGSWSWTSAEGTAHPLAAHYDPAVWGPASLSTSPARAHRPFADHRERRARFLVQTDPDAEQSQLPAFRSAELESCFGPVHSSYRE